MLGYLQEHLKGRDGNRHVEFNLVVLCSPTAPAWAAWPSEVGGWKDESLHSRMGSFCAEFSPASLLVSFPGSVLQWHQVRKKVLVPPASLSFLFKREN